jgi:hypothetical protein
LDAGFQPFDQGKRCLLRVCNDRETADVDEVRRRHEHGATKTFDGLDGRIDIVDGHISDPSRRRAGLPRTFWHLHESAGEGVADREKRVRQIRHRRVLHAPAQNLGIERPGRRVVRRHQLVPDETALVIDHVLDLRAC